MIRVRVYVGQDGYVRDIKVLQANSLDASFVERLVLSLKATRFLAGRLNGQAVAAYSDIELSFPAPPEALQSVPDAVILR